MQDPVKKAQEKRRAERDQLQRARERVRAAKDARRADMERERKARDAEAKARREKDIKEHDRGDKDKADLYKLTTLAMKQIPGSPKQKATIKKLNVLRKKNGMKPLKEEDIDESLWANIHKKRQRIKKGSGERMRKKGEKGAPTPAQMKRAKGESVNEDAKMAKLSDDQLKALLKKLQDFRKKEPKAPSTQFFIKRVEKEMKKRKLTEAKMPPMNYVIYDKKTKEVYAASSKPFDKFKMDDVADDMKVKKSNLVMKKMKKGQEVDSKLKEQNEAKTDFAVNDTVSFKWPSSISMSVPQKNRKPGGFVKGILTKVDRTRAKVKIGNKVYSVSTSELTKEKDKLKEAVKFTPIKKNDKKIPYGRDSIISKDSVPSPAPMFSQMSKAVKSTDNSHPKYGKGTAIETKKGVVHIKPEVADLYLKSRKQLPTPIQKNMDKMAERSPDGLFTVLHAALNDLQTGMIESMEKVMKEALKYKTVVKIKGKSMGLVYGPAAKQKTQAAYSSEYDKNPKYVIHKYKSGFGIFAPVKEEAMKEEVLVEADSLYLIYKDKMKAKKVAAHIKARHKKFDVNLAPMDAKNMGITVFGKGAEKVKADVTKKYGKPDDFMMEDFSDTSIEEV